LNLELVSAIVLVIGTLSLEAVLIHLVAKAAQRKGRSYQSFFWLATVFRAVLVWPIVAALPFLPGDPASPLKDTRPDEPGERYVNPALEQPLLTRGVLAGLVGSGLVVLIGSIAVIGLIFSLIIGQITQITRSTTSVTSTVQKVDSLTGGTTQISTNTTDTAASIDNCDRLLLGADIAQGYTAGSSCLAWRWTTKIEQKSLHCDQYSWCTFAGLYALSACKSPTLVATFKDAQGKDLGSDVDTGADLRSGERANLEIGSPKFKTWQSAVITSAYCGA